MAATPMYQQIADDLRKQIELGVLAPGGQLPTELELRERYDASRNTVRDAIKRLTIQGLVETRSGHGTFVTLKVKPYVTVLSIDPQAGLHGGEEGATYPSLMLAQRQQGEAGTPEVKVLACPPHIASQLRIKAGEDVVSRQQERYIDYAIWSLQTSYYPMTWVQKGAEGLLRPVNIPEGAVAYLAQIIGLKQAGYRDLVSARLPDDKEQEFLKLTHNHTVIEVCRTSFAEDETPIRVTVTVYPSDRNQIAYDVGRVPDHRDDPVQS